MEVFSINLCTDKNTLVLKNRSYNNILEKIELSTDTSVICFDNKFNFNSDLYKKFLNKSFDKLIIISNQSNNKKLKRLYISKYLKKNFLEHVKKNLLIIINPSVNYKEAKMTIKGLIKLKKLTQKLNINLNICIQEQNIIGMLINTNSSYESDFITAIEAINE